jgi:hypothetical protein
MKSMFFLTSVLMAILVNPSFAATTKEYVELLEKRRVQVIEVADETQKYLDLNHAKLPFTARELVAHWLNSRIGRGWPAKRPLPAKMSELLEDNSVNWPADYVAEHFKIVQEAMGIFFEVNGSMAKQEKAIYQVENRGSLPEFTNANEETKIQLLAEWISTMRTGDRFDKICAKELGAQVRSGNVPHAKELAFKVCVAERMAKYRQENREKYLKWDNGTYVFRGYEAFGIDFSRRCE